MSRAFTAKFTIVGSGPIAPGPDTFEVFGDIVDLSLAGYSVTDAIVGDIFFDVNSLTGVTNRYVVTSIITTGSGAYGGGNSNSIHLYCKWDDQGPYDPSGPEAGDGAISASTPSHHLAELPTVSGHGISESLQVSMENTDTRYEIDHLTGADQPTLVTLTNGAGGLIPQGTPVRVDSTGKANVVDVSVPAQCKAVIGLAYADIANGASGYIATDGRVPAPLSLTPTAGDSIYVSHSGGLTNVVPDIVPFASGDSMVYVGTAVPNLANPSLFDIVIDISLIAEL